MSNKKYFLLAFVVALVTLSNKSAFSQTESTSGSSSVYRGAGYDVLDTSLIPERRMEQQRDFLTNQYDFPSKPRNQWEIGVSFSFSVSGNGNVKNLFTAKNPGQTMGFGLHLRKAWGYIISTRLQYLMEQLLDLTGKVQQAIGLTTIIILGINIIPTEIVQNLFFITTKQMLMNYHSS